MSWQLKIKQAKPNPLGKDTDSYGTPKPDKLLGEWVDIHNEGDRDADLSLVHLCNQEFLLGCVPKPNPVIYWSGSFGSVLKAGQILRVHTGKAAFSSWMNNSDATGAHLHAYAEKGHFVLNNKCGDTISIFWKNSDGIWHKEDTATYNANPPEGGVLVRLGSLLIPAYIAV